MKTYYKEICLGDGSYYEGMGYDMGGEFVFHGDGKRYNKKGELVYEGNFIDGKSSGKGKEYLLGKLRYEGDYLNGKRHGGGMEYVGGRVLYKGDFRHGVPYGTGISYAEDGSILNTGIYVNGYYYEGDLVDGKACGTGKLYDIYSSKLQYEGDMKNDASDGNGIKYNFDGTCGYRGEFVNGFPHGKGKMYLSRGRIREGVFVHGNYYVGNVSGGKANGRGRLYDSQNYLIYEGDFVDGFEHGQGKQYELAKYLCYEGGFARGYREGQGKQYKNNVLFYEGGFKDGHWQGEGSLYADGIIRYKGDFVHGREHGKGILFNQYGRPLYIGDFSNGRQHGKGSGYVDGKLFYIGDFSGGQTTGYGAVYVDGRLFYEGRFVEGEINGLGRRYNPDGSVRLEGVFRGDRLIESVPFVPCGIEPACLKAPLIPAEVSRIPVRAAMAPPLPAKEVLVLKEEDDFLGRKLDSGEGIPEFAGKYF